MKKKYLQIILNHTLDYTFLKFKSSYFFVFIFFLCQLVNGQNPKTKTNTSWENLILLSKTVGVNSDGIKIQYYKNRGNKYTNDWIFPWTIGVENYTIDSKLILKSNYRSYSSGYFGIGRNAIKHFKNNFYFNINASIVLGTEKLIDYSSERFDRILIGMTTSQGLLFIPKSKYGVVFGASIFEKAFTSKIYSFDLGIKLSVGVKF